jgi:hypothetical protein
MPQDSSRRELVQLAGAAAVSMVAAIAWTSTERPEPAEAATGAESAAPASTLFRWIGI